MAAQDAKEAIRRTFTVEVPVERAFVLFTEGLTTWWPPEYTWAKDTLEMIGIEPEQGGRCFECGPHGFACDWGRVLEWIPPHRLVFSWQIGPTRVPEPNPDKASKVEVRFEADGSEATKVEFEHRGFARHGKGAAEYCEAMGSAQGWDYILGRYQQAVL